MINVNKKYIITIIVSLAVMASSLFYVYYNLDGVGSTGMNVACVSFVLACLSLLYGGLKQMLMSINRQ